MSAKVGLVHQEVDRHGEGLHSLDPFGEVGGPNPPQLAGLCSEGEISAGNFDGKPGPHLFNLHEILG